MCKNCDKLYNLGFVNLDKSICDNIKEENDFWIFFEEYILQIIEKYENIFDNSDDSNFLRTINILKFCGLLDEKCEYISSILPPNHDCIKNIISHFQTKK